MMMVTMATVNTSISLLTNGDGMAHKPLYLPVSCDLPCLLGEHYKIYLHMFTQ